MKNILVVGGAGFVGSHLVRRLAEFPEVQRIVVLDNLSSGKWSRLPSSPKIEVNCGDARSLGAIIESIAGCDTVFHLAANPDIARAAKEPTIDFEQGTVLTQNVLEAMRRTGAKRLIYFSGSGVYGDAGDRALLEADPCAPISPYGANKLASEALIHAYSAMFGLTARIFRPANIIGPGQTHGVGYDFLRKLKADPMRLKILGDGTQSKSYLHIDDMIDAVLVALDDPRMCAVYNVATDDYLTVDQIAAAAINAAHLDVNMVAFGYSGGSRGWNGDVPVVRLNCDGIRALGWKPKWTSREAMADALLCMAMELK